MSATLGASRRWAVVIALILGLAAASCLTPASPWGSLGLALLWLLPIGMAGSAHSLLTLLAWLAAASSLLLHAYLGDAVPIELLLYEPAVTGPIFFLAICAILSFLAFYPEARSESPATPAPVAGTAARIHHWEFPRNAGAEELGSDALRESPPSIELPDRLDILQRASHELTQRANNTLGAIRAALDIVDHRIGSNSDLATFSELARHELLQLDAVCKAFHVLTAPPQISSRGCDPNPPIVRALETARAQFPSVHFQAELDPTTPRVPLTEEAVERAVLELMKNAAEAMAGHGTVTVESYRRGKNSVIAVGDTGHGIAPADRDSVFLPFFTTRPGRLGMGLAICHKLVKDGSGNIALTTRTGQGSTLKLLLPVLSRVETRAQPEHSQ